MVAEREQSEKQGRPEPFSARRSYALIAALMLAAIPCTIISAQTPSSPSYSAVDARDPVLHLADTTVDYHAFRAVIADAVLRDPSLAEAQAGEREAAAMNTQARAARLPRATIALTSNQSIARGFSSGIDTLVEQSMAQRRSDVTLNIDQPVMDFGAAGSRVAASSARMSAASQIAADSASTTALDAILAWYDVFANRAVLALSQDAVARQVALRQDVEQRIESGYLAQGDLARADSYLAASRARMARSQRALATAEARYTQLLETPPSPAIGRVSLGPVAGVGETSADAAQGDAASTPAVLIAESLANAARREARAAKADQLPNLGLSVAAGRYGVFENNNDYSVSARATLRMRLSGGFNAAWRQADARADAADARADRARRDAERDAAIAWSDVAALGDELAALEDNYKAARISRDVLAERFRISRGTLFDLLESEDAYIETARSYVETLARLDTARFALLARRGRLLPSLDINPEQLDNHVDRKAVSR